MDRHTLSNGRLGAAIKADGAELCSLTLDGRELLWQAGPEWPRHAPVLFPIVGRLKDDTLRHRGQTYRMTQHGFARDRRFAWEERTATLCRLSLSDDAQTRALYPFAFRLELIFELDAEGLTIRHRITNPGAEALPASLGVHPAFLWPLQEGIPKEAHELLFETDEPAPIRRVDGGLLAPQPEPTPVEGRRLPLNERLFTRDAVILDRPASHAVRYGAPGTPAITVSWEGFRELGIWSKPTGAPFLCIEPWHGHASPADFDGEFADKPGLLHLEPGAMRELSYRIAVA
ncbi:aldose 1-epimerase family protein [Azospirillum formosense]|uniref:Aldose 1-epimerase family protein n=1 Tax=Azospirillum formosense TaxID=861533 RepID=A0ABX2KML7_9PROT|nr:aldose 1-epimerase family protein [Azospirillum formosense]MBY3756146.1 aldose 1-epimerase family protein [Azospirillum formosense]NUB17871.1 aldose 1-epimerase family protein [Azospirillum formosense]